MYFTNIKHKLSIMQNQQSYQSSSNSNYDDDYGQFCDLENYSIDTPQNTPTKRQGSPTLETINETKPKYGSIDNINESQNISCDDMSNIKHDHTLINGIENILNAKQYIHKILLETPETKRQFIQYLVCSSLVCALVIITWK